MKNIDVLKTLRDGRKPVILFGASVGGRKLFYFLHETVNIISFCDNYKSGQEPFSGLKIIDPAELVACFSDALICICAQSPTLHAEIYSQLLELSFPDEHIFSFEQVANAVAEEKGGKFTWQECEGVFDWNCNHRSIEKMAQWISEGDNSVIDFGAGDCFLKHCLRPGIVYTPTDYIARSPEFVVYDFNKDPFPLIHADVCFLAFVVHYMERWKELLCKVFQAAEKKVIIGIGCSTDRANTALLNGAMIEFTNDSDIVLLAENCDFVLQERHVEPQGDGLIRNDILLLFVRR